MYRWTVKRVNLNVTETRSSKEMFLTLIFMFLFFIAFFSKFRTLNLCLEKQKQKKAQTTKWRKSNASAMQSDTSSDCKNMGESHEVRGKGRSTSSRLLTFCERSNANSWVKGREKERKLLTISFFSPQTFQTFLLHSSLQN
jgi:hypothetical protein